MQDRGLPQAGDMHLLLSNISHRMFNHLRRRVCSFLSLRRLFRRLLSVRCGGVCCSAEPLTLLLSGKPKMAWPVNAKDRAIRLSVNKRRAKTQQKKRKQAVLEKKKLFPNLSFFVFCHITFSRFVFWETQHVSTETALTRATILPCQEHSPHNWRVGVQPLSWDLQTVMWV